MCESITRQASASAHLQVGGFVPYSSVDCPGQLAAVVFVQGCSWSCGYCQNAHLRSFGETAEGRWETVEAQLQRRRGLLDMVIFSGGEPLAQLGLQAAMEQVRALGFKVGLHSAGASPRRLRAILPLCDWVGLDIKALEADYPGLTGRAASGAQAYACLDQLLQSGRAYEVRTTWHPRLFSAERLLELAEQLYQRGVRHFRLQRLQARACLDPSLHSWPPVPEDPQLWQRLGQIFPDFMAR